VFSQQVSKLSPPLTLGCLCLGNGLEWKNQNILAVQ
jgi:hypothetical protein